MGSFKHLLPTKHQTACESYKIASAMHTIVFVDWSIEAKTAQVTNESVIFDGFVPTMIQWCDGASTAIGTKKMTKIIVLTTSRGEKLSVAEVGTKLAQVEPKLAQVRSKLVQVRSKLSLSWR